MFRSLLHYVIKMSKSKHSSVLDLYHFDVQHSNVECQNVKLFDIQHSNVEIQNENLKLFHVRHSNDKVKW